MGFAPCVSPSFPPSPVSLSLLAIDLSRHPDPSLRDPGTWGGGGGVLGAVGNDLSMFVVVSLRLSAVAFSGCCWEL